VPPNQQTDGTIQNDDEEESEEEEEQDT